MRALSLAFTAALVLASCVEQPLDLAGQGAALSGEPQNLTPNTCIGVGAAIRVTNGGWRGCDLGKEIERFDCDEKNGAWLYIYETHRGVLVFANRADEQITALKRSLTTSGTLYSAKHFSLLVTGNKATLTRSSARRNCVRRYR